MTKQALRNGLGGDNLRTPFSWQKVFYLTTLLQCCQVLTPVTYMLF